MTKKSFILYHDLCEALDELTDEQAGQLFKSIASYSQSLTQGNPNKPTGLTGLLKAIAIPFYAHISRDYGRWVGISERNKSNGIKGGRPKSITQINPNNPNEPVKVKVKVKVTDKVNDNDSSNGRKESAAPKLLTKEIIEDDYPLYTKYAFDKWGWTPRQIESEVKEFLAYWTYGEGAGKKRKSWLLTWQKKVRANYGNINNKGE